MLYLWIAKFRLFVDKLKQNIAFQLFVGLVPCVFCFIYSSAFLVDTLNTYSTLVINDKVVLEGKQKGVILETKEVDNTYQIYSNKTLTLTDTDNGLVCNLNFEEYNDTVFYTFETDYLGFLTLFLCDFVEYNTETNNFTVLDTYTVEKTDSKHIGKILYYDNNFYINLGDNDILLENPINFNLVDNKIIVNNIFTVDKDIKNNEVYFTTKLDKDNVFFDGLNYKFIQNINHNFFLDFIKETNCIFVFSLFCFYIVLMCIINNYIDTVELKYSKPIACANIVGLCTLSLVVLFAFILFS